jgi:hypothetical protein
MLVIIWETFVSRIEHDPHGRQINAYKIIKYLNRTEKDNLQFNPIPEHTWLYYYQTLWTKQPNDNTTEGESAKLTEKCVDLITMEKIIILKLILYKLFWYTDIDWTEYAQDVDQ